MVPGSQPTHGDACGQQEIPPPPPPHQAEEEADQDDSSTSSDDDQPAHTSAQRRRLEKEAKAKQHVLPHTPQTNSVTHAGDVKPSVSVLDVERI